MPELRIALIGSGFMGRAHAMAFAAAARTFELGVTPVLEILADRDDAAAAEAARTLGFARSTGDWRAAVSDPAVDLVAITTPNVLHAPIALAAIAAGKAVYCEKPLAVTLDDAAAMTRAAEGAGRPTAVGFTYLFNPMISVAREIVRGGEIGEVTAFRGIHAEDFMASADAPFNWRCEPGNAGGALADIGSHCIAMARHLVGEIAAVSGQLHTVHSTRSGKPVEVDDQADAVIRFDNGATGSVACSWIATGRKMGLQFEITGTKGALSFTQDRLNELRIYRPGTRGREGFLTIEAGPEHAEYGAFCPASGHQLGYNDLKTIEAKAAIDAALGRPNAAKDFRYAWTVMCVDAAIRQSHVEQRWVEVVRPSRPVHLS